MTSYQRGEGNQAAARTLEQFAPCINKYAHKFIKRASGLGSPLELDDIRQELSLCFLRCVKSYDPDKAGSFLNFFISACYHEFNRLMRKEQRNRDIGHTSTDVRANSNGEGYSVFDAVDSGWASPQDFVQALSSGQHLLSTLSDPARVLVEILMDPPPLIVDQFNLQRLGMASQREATQMQMRCTADITFPFLFKLFGIERTNAKHLMREIHQKVGASFCLESNYA